MITNPDTPRRKSDEQALRPTYRYVLRCQQHDAVGSLLDIQLPAAVGSSVSRAGVHALRPDADGWLILANEPIFQPAQTWRDIGASLVDNSDRQIAIMVSGANVHRWLANGCPLDLSTTAFPVRRCARTRFHKADILLWRTGPHHFHIEVGRTSASYVQHKLFIASNVKS